MNSDAPEEDDSSGGHDSKDQLERCADAEEIRELVPTGSVDHEVRLVADWGK